MLTVLACMLSGLLAQGGAGAPGELQSPPRDPRQTPQVGSGSISGRVTAADTGAPVKRALVSLSGGQPGRSVLTDHEGRYQFSSLPPGTYYVFASPGTYRAGYQPTGYGTSLSASGSPLRGKPLELADGQKLENIDIALPRTGVIAGRVTDADGEPAARIQVTAWVLRPGAEPTQSAGAQTDDLGQFRIFNLAPGDYVVLASPALGAGSQTPVDGEPVGFAPTYAPGTPARNEAMRVRVARGGQASADVRLAETRVYGISGTVLNSRGEPLRNPMVMLSRPDGPGGGFGSSVSPTGTFAFRNVPPGQYELIARSMPSPAGGAAGPSLDTAQEYASMSVEVSTTNVEGITLVTRPGAVVSGQIVTDEALPEGRRVTMSAQTPERRQFNSPPTIEVKDTTFTMRNVFGPVVLRGGVQAPGWGLKAVLLRGRDITDEPTTLTENDSGHLQVVFTALAPAIDGRVVDEAGRPVEEGTIVVFGEDARTWVPRSSYFRLARVTQEGKFTLPGLREGRYFVVAVPPDVIPGMTQPSQELFEALSRVATRVTLNPGERRAIDLALMKPQDP